MPITSRKKFPKPKSVSKRFTIFEEILHGLEEGRSGFVKNLFVGLFDPLGDVPPAIVRLDSVVILARRDLVDICDCFFNFLEKRFSIRVCQIEEIARQDFWSSPNIGGHYDKP